MDNSDFAGLSEAFGSLLGTNFADDAFDVAPMARTRSVGFHADSSKPAVSDASVAAGFFAVDPVSGPACRLVVEP